ncbi:MAG: permease-like cell division protein FtsX [Patescibacteria group bacterium]
MITLWRIFVASWKHVGRNAWIGIATIFVFMMALGAVNILLGMNAMLGRTITLLEERIDVTVSFKADTPEAVVNQARFYMSSLPQIRDVSFRTSEEVLAQFRERHAGEGKVLGALEEIGKNPLGAQLVMKARSSEDYPFLVRAIQNPQYAPFVDNQTYDDHRVAIERVQDVGRKVRVVGAALVAIFALFGLLIAFNAIRVAVYTQREEIAIMRLVGASSFYIRAPFILEGIWLSLFSMLCSAVMVYAALTWVEPALVPLFDGADTGLRTFFFGNAVKIIVIQTLSLVVLVTMVSWAAAGRYIKR